MNYVADKTYTVTCTAANGSSCYGEGTWSEYPECIIETEPFSVPYGTNVTREMILEHADITPCVDDPQVYIDYPAKSYTIRCTDANNCTCTGNGTWTVRPECTLETEPFSVCYGIVPTVDQIIEHVDITPCTDRPVVTYGKGKTYTVTCTAANGSSCYGEGTWSEYPECIIETEPFSVPSGTDVTPDDDPGARRPNPLRGRSPG